MNGSSSLPQDALRLTLARVRHANAEVAKRYPGESGRRQPVHTVYGGAHLFRADSAKKIGQVALRTIDDYAPDPETFANALALAGSARLAETLHERVRDKLAGEPVEDFRVDFEDGYGHRADAEEDGHAEAAARAMARGLAASQLPPFVGIRIKPFTTELIDRSVRTLDLFLTALVRETGGMLPANFVVTLPKIATPVEVAALVDLFELFEPALGLPAGALKLEVMIETPQAIVNADGRTSVPAFVDAARGRCVGAHFGAYDFTAACHVAASQQHLLHDSCDFARHVMQVALAGTGISVSDGATNVLPVAPHRTAAGAPPLTPAQRDDNRRVVHAAWRLHYDHVRHSLAHGFYQGWDIHPAQLPTRYAAVYAFFLESVDAVGTRLRNFVEQAARATLVGAIFDDAATGQGLLNFFVRAVTCGALTEEEATAKAGVTLAELHARSFSKIAEARRA